LAALFACAPALAQTPTLQAGVGRADITPPTGYYMMGWVRSDALSTGQQSRLYARAIVLREGGRKIALVAEDLNGIPGGMLAAAADLDKDIGFSQSNVLDSASHTHSGPAGFYNFPTYNTVFMTVHSLTSFNLSGSLDPQLYAFEVRELALAIRRANANLGPARAGWGSTQLLGLTQNRSLEAHLADYGIMENPGQGNVMQDPLGYPDTIDPNVDVLRVDKLLPTGAASSKCTPRSSPKRKRHAHRAARRTGAKRRHKKKLPARACSGAGATRWTPVGIWSQFANHGTVVKYTFHYYNADHHAMATRMVESELRRQGGAPAGQDVVAAYGNSDEGDQTAGIAHSGPADAEWVGGVEAHAFLDAWRQAGQNMSQSPALDWRWTRVCFCGQPTSDGIVAADPQFGLAEVTGSEEGRGPLYDLTGISMEGYHAPVDNGAQGDKLPFAPGSANVPHAVPMMALRVADRMIVSIPGEMTVGMGQRVRKAVLDASAGAGIARVVIAGLANEYLSYFTTPEEYERQHYEAADTLYGKTASLVLQGTLAELAGRLAHGQPDPTPYPYDPINGVAATAAPFSSGPSSATADAQPQRTARLGHAIFAWSGGLRGFDRPIGGAFVHVRRNVGGVWTDFTDDLGLQILWQVDDKGNYNASWEVPLDAPAGGYDFVITANHYTLESAPFDVVPTDALKVTAQRSADGHAQLTLNYPRAIENTDFTYRPLAADGGSVTASTGGATRTVTQGSGTTFDVPAAASDSITVAPGAFTDRYGNRNGEGASFQES
jgi:neutral ceramidase